MPIFYIKDGTGNFVPVPALQGKQGDPGVYVGTEQPDDAQVWVKPDGEADPILLYEEQELTDEQKAQARANIGAAEEGVLPPATADRLGGMMPGDGLTVDEYGRTSVEPEPDYALITTIEGKEGEEVGVIELDTTPDGKPYAFSAIRVEYVCHNTERLGSVSARFYYTNSECAEITLGMSSMSPGAVAEHNAIVDHGMLSVTQTYWSNYEWVSDARQAQPRRYLIGDKKICKVRLSKNDYFDGLTLRIQGRA